MPAAAPPGLAVRAAAARPAAGAGPAAEEEAASSAAAGSGGTWRAGRVKGAAAPKAASELLADSGPAGADASAPPAFLPPRVARYPASTATSLRTWPGFMPPLSSATVSEAVMDRKEARQSKPADSCGSRGEPTREWVRQKLFFSGASSPPTYQWLQVLIAGELKLTEQTRECSFLRSASGAAPMFRCLRSRLPQAARTEETERQNRAGQHHRPHHQHARLPVREALRPRHDARCSAPSSVPRSPCRFTFVLDQ